jgi:hypothetical protein
MLAGGRSQRRAHHPQQAQRTTLDGKLPSLQQIERGHASMGHGNRDTETGTRTHYGTALSWISQKAYESRSCQRRPPLSLGREPRGRGWERAAPYRRLHSGWIRQSGRRDRVQRLSCRNRMGRPLPTSPTMLRIWERRGPGKRPLWLETCLEPGARNRTFRRRARWRTPSEAVQGNAETSAIALTFRSRWQGATIEPVRRRSNLYRQSSIVLVLRARHGEVESISPVRRTLSF